MRKTNSSLPVERVENRILIVRGQKVLLDRDLAAIYDAETRTLNQAIKRNKDRFPEDFAFQLSKNEFDDLISQNVISSPRSWGGLRHLPYVFTEHGALMAAAILKSKTAVKTSITVVRAFVRMRRLIEDNAKVARKLNELEKRMDNHDQNTVVIMATIKKLISAPQPLKKTRIGFRR
jgi:hypothetical protein